MKAGKGLKNIITAALGLIILILDSRSAIDGAVDGIEICLRTVIPSLFPFLFLSSLLTSTFPSDALGGGNFVCRLFRLPLGSGGILLAGLLGGYPVGAKCIGEAVAQGRLSQRDGERMLVFCNAAGPAFIFGVTSSLFPQRWVPWCLWVIQILSAFAMARLLPAHPGHFAVQSGTGDVSVTQTLRKSIHVMSEICGWIILMRIVIVMLKRWFLWQLSATWQMAVSGLLELSNGCVGLNEIACNGLRFILCSVFLGFGGICVALQTSSAADRVGQRGYIPGKLVQSCICFLLSYLVQYLCFRREERAALPCLFFIIPFAVLAFFLIFVVRSKKSCGKFQNIGV